MTGFSVFDQAALGAVRQRLNQAVPLAQRRRAAGVTLHRLAALSGVCKATLVRVQAGYEVKRSTRQRIDAALQALEGAQV